MFLRALEEPGGDFHRFSLCPLLPSVKNGGECVCCDLRRNLWAWRNTFLFGQIIHPILFWLLEAKRSGISFSYHFLHFSSLDITSINSFLWFSVNMLFRGLSDIAKKNWKFKNKTEKQKFSVVHNMSYVPSLSLATKH